MTNPFTNIFKKKPPKKPPMPPSWQMPKDYYFPIPQTQNYNAAALAISQQHQKIQQYRLEEKRKNDLASSPEIHGILDQVPTYIPEANHFQYSNVVLNTATNFTVEASSPTGRGYQVNLLFDCSILGFDEVLINQVKLQVEVSNRRLVDECLDPSIPSDLIGGFSYAKQVCDAWYAETQILQTQTPGAFPQGVYLSSCAFPVQGDGRTIHINADEILFISATSGSGNSLYGLEVKAEDLWHAYEQNWLKFKAVPTAQVVVATPMCLNDLMTGGRLWLPEKDTFEIAPFTDDTHTGAVLRKPDRRELHVGESGLIDALNHREILLLKKG